MSDLFVEREAASLRPHGTQGDRLKLRAGPGKPRKGLRIHVTDLPA